MNMSENYKFMSQSVYVKEKPPPPIFSEEESMAKMGVLGKY